MFSCVQTHSYRVFMRADTFTETVNGNKGPRALAALAQGHTHRYGDALLSVGGHKGDRPLRGERHKCTPYRVF